MSKSTNILYCMSFMTVHGLLQERCPDYMFSYFPTGPVKQLFSIKLPLFSYPSIEYVLDLICFGCSKEPSQKDCSFEYTQHMFWLRNNKIIFIYTHLSGLHIRSLYVGTWSFWLIFV